MAVSIPGPTRPNGPQWPPFAFSRFVAMISPFFFHLYGVIGEILRVFAISYIVLPQDASNSLRSILGAVATARPRDYG